MALVAANVRVGRAGVIAKAPVGTTLPTGITGMTGFIDLGYASDEGVAEARDTSTEKIKAWQNAAEVRVVIVESSLVYKFSLIETKKEVIEVFYQGLSTAATGAGSIVVNPSAQLAASPWLIDVIDGEHVIRTVIPSGQLTKFEEVKSANGEPISYGVELTCYPDAGIGGSAIKYMTVLATP